jgi:hypothetical protein
MSQFAELFKAVKNEPKRSSGDIENKKPGPIKNLKQVKTKNETSRENESVNALNSDVQTKKKITQISEKAGEANNPDERLSQIQKESKVINRPKKIGKSSNADYTQVLTYIRRDIHRQIKKVLIDDPDERNLSDLVEELLSEWLKKNL